MVNIDTVYQKVLSISSKEQRGYITPQEFNLLANKAQNEIYDSYFHDFKTLDMKPKVDQTHADNKSLLEAKLHPFMKSQYVATQNYSAVQANEASFTLNTDVYRIEWVRSARTGLESQVLNEITMKEHEEFEEHPLTKNSTSSWNPAWFRGPSVGSISITGPSISSSACTVYYYKIPLSPKWGYVVVNGEALYSSTASTNFELHVSEEEVLVAKILQLAGVVIQKPELTQAGGGMEQVINQTQND